MADRVWKGVYPKVFGSSRQVSLNKFFDPSTPSMRKVDDGKKEKKRKEKKNKKEKNGVFSGHYVIASSLPPERLRPNGYARTATPERRPLECCTLVPKVRFKHKKKIRKIKN